MKLGGTRTVSYTSDGRKVWTYTTSIGTAGAGRHITVAVARKGETFFKHSEFDIDVLSPAPELVSAEFERDTCVAGQPVTLTVITDTLATKVELVNEYGLKISTSGASYYNSDGQRIWNIPVVIGTPGDRVLTVKAKDRLGQYAQTELPLPIIVTRAK